VPTARPIRSRREAITTWRQPTGVLEPSEAGTGSGASHDRRHSGRAGRGMYDSLGNPSRRAPRAGGKASVPGYLAPVGLPARLPFDLPLLGLKACSPLRAFATATALPQQRHRPAAFAAQLHTCTLRCVSVDGGVSAPRRASSRVGAGTGGVAAGGRGWAGSLATETWRKLQGASWAASDALSMEGHAH